MIDITDAARAATPRTIFNLFDYGVFYCPQFINEQNIPSADVRAYSCVKEGHRCFFNSIGIGTNFHPFVLNSFIRSQAAILLAILDDPTRVDGGVDGEDRQNLRDVGQFNGFTNCALLSLVFAIEFNRFQFIGSLFCLFSLNFSCHSLMLLISLQGGGGVHCVPRFSPSCGRGGFDFSFQGYFHFASQTTFSLSKWSRTKASSRTSHFWWGEESRRALCEPTCILTEEGGSPVLYLGCKVGEIKN